MKRKITITHDGKSITGLSSIRLKEFYLSAMSYHPNTIHKNKKKYCRREKHKKDLTDLS